MAYGGRDRNGDGSPGTAGGRYDENRRGNPSAGCTRQYRPHGYDQGRYAEVIPFAQRILDRLDHYEQHAKDYAEDSYRLSWSDKPADRDRYIDFSRAQANGFLAGAYAMTGDVAHAREYLARFDQSGYGHSFGARRMIIPTQMALGMYDEAMVTCDEMVYRMGNDTVNDDYAVILRDRAIVARAKGHVAEAYDLMNRHANLAKVLSDSLHASEAHDYAARYHAQEQELKIRETESASRIKSIIIGVIVLLFMSARSSARRTMPWYV